MDDGSTASTNRLTWATIKTKLPDPIKTYVDAIATALTSVFDTSARAITADDSSAATDHDRVIQVNTSSVNVTLADAATMAAGYTVTVANQSSGQISVKLATASDKIDNVTNATQTLSLKEARTFLVNAAANGYLTKSVGSGAASVALAGICEGRLSLTSGSAVTTGDVSAATTVYFTPYKGSRVATFDGTQWSVSAFTEKSVAVPATTVTPFDVFIVDSTLALETVNWTNDTTRATAVVLQNGVYVKSGSTTRRYLGTCRTTGVSGQTEDSKANRFVWNYYNRILRDTLTNYTADRSTTSSSFTELNTEIRPGIVIGVAEDSVCASTVGSGTNASNGNAFTAGIAFDSTSAVDAGFESVVFNNGASMDSPVAISGLKVGLAAGFHYATILVRSPNGANTVTLRGTTGNGSAKVYMHLGIQG